MKITWKKKKIVAFSMILMLLLTVCPVYADSLSRMDTPDYKVAYYAFDCFNMQDENGKRSGYGYEMMQGISKYLQCTFSYVGYEKSASECVDMLRNGELDIYTAAKKTPEREAEFAFSTHPSITSTTCMNVKVGNKKIVAGDYSTYNGIKIGLLQRHTYNDAFLKFADEKGFDYEIIYYETPTELTNALINDEVDALVNSYIRTPEDEKVIENFGETPYYLMVRKEDQSLMDQLDYAIDCMNEETPNWRTDLYNKYYGAQKSNTEYTEEEANLLRKMRQENKKIRAVMSPDANPYSWYDKNGKARGIVADLFRKTARSLGLDYEIVTVSSKEEYEELLGNGDVDIWMDLEGYYEDERETKYKTTDPYLETTVSVVRRRGASQKVQKLVIDNDNIAIREIVSATWPDAEVEVAGTVEECKQKVLEENADAALLMSYTAQRVARDDLQNRLRVEIVPGASVDMKMGVNANIDAHFYGLWEKTLANVAATDSTEIVQKYLEETATPGVISYIFDHPQYLILIIGCAFLILFLIIMYLQSVGAKKKQEKISGELAIALEKAEEANEMKQEFFSKMSHDIRTPLNVVLGMTQVAQKYKDDRGRLENALDNITTEGNYLLVLINSILDVNQLEHGSAELVEAPFNPATCVRKSAEILRPLADKKEQRMTVECESDQCVVIGDANRFSQIIINIVSNAIKYTNAGGMVELKFECLPDHWYRFICTDNGIGMTQEFIRHICEDYTRAEDSRVSKTQGTGLGMSVVKGFVDLMNGRLEIESELGKGSRFVIDLPFEDASEEEREGILHPITREEEHDRYTGKKVLLVEDNALNAEIATELLQSIGLQVEWADNGEIGVEMFQSSAQGEYFAVFMDMQMPVMDGVTATKVIRNLEREDNNIPIFAMTANTFAVDRKKCMDAGMTGYISKPVSVEDIEETLNENMK